MNWAHFTLVSCAGALALLLGRPEIARAQAKPGVRPAPTFQKDVLPILEANCLRCHGAKARRGGLDLRMVATIRKGGDTGAAVLPGAVEKSLLWHRLESDEMPPVKAKLPEAAKAAIRDWIAAGATDAPLPARPLLAGTGEGRGGEASAGEDRREHRHKNRRRGRRGGRDKSGDLLPEPVRPGRRSL